MSPIQSRKYTILLFAAFILTTPLSAQRHRAVLPIERTTTEPITHSFAEGGYADATSVVQGGTITFFVANKINPFTLTISNLATPDVTMAIFNNLVASQNDCTGDWENGCGWHPTQSFQVPSTWPSGYYDAHFTTSIGPKHIIFVVKASNPGATSPTLVVQPTNTYQAYNAYGGKSSYPADSPDRAHKLSFNRPYDDQNGLGIFRLWELPFVNWMTAERRSFEVATDTDLEDPTLLSHYKLVIVIGHSEYWTLNARQNLETFSRNGGHVAVLAGNTMWYQVRLEDGGRTLVSYKDATIDPATATTPSLATTNWYDWPIYHPENLALGLSYRSGGYANKVADPNVFDTKPLDQRVGYTIVDSSSWVFQNTGKAIGSSFGNGAAGLEVDGARYNCSASDPLNLAVDGSDGTPLNFHILAKTPSEYGHGVIGTFTNPGGGMVFNAGTRDWAAALAIDPVVAQMTRNVLDRLSTGQPQAFDAVTSAVKTRETFNCPTDSPALLPGWRGDVGEAKVSSRCAQDGPTGLELTGVPGVQVARNFAPSNDTLKSVDATAFVNADGFTGPNNAPQTLFALQNHILPSGTNQRFAIVEINVTAAGKQLRLVQDAADGSVEARSQFVSLLPGWNRVRLLWTSPGTISLQVGDGSPVTLNNTHNDQSVGEFVVAYPRDPQVAYGFLCVDTIAVATPAP